LKRYLKFKLCAISPHLERKLKPIRKECTTVESKTVKIQILRTRFFRPRVANLRPKLESRISHFSIFLVYYVFLQFFFLLCGPKSRYFWQIFQVASQRPIWVGHPCLRHYESNFLVYNEKQGDVTVFFAREIL
jgi:hypothetical protein